MYGERKEKGRKPIFVSLNNTVTKQIVETPMSMLPNSDDILMEQFTCLEKHKTLKTDKSCHFAAMKCRVIVLKDKFYFCND